jgi:hypothetical protein
LSIMPSVALIVRAALSSSVRIAAVRPGQVGVVVGGRVDPVVAVHVVPGEPVPLRLRGGLAGRREIRVQVRPDHQPVLVTGPFHGEDALVAVKADLRLVLAHEASVAAAARSGR